MIEYDRFIRFPDDRCIGEFIDSSDARVKAQGTVRVIGAPKALHVSAEGCRDLHFLQGLDTDGFAWISFAYCPIDDSALTHLTHLRGLKVLDLSGTAITERGLELLHMLTLENLSLANTRISSLRWLRHFPSLISLDISACGITDSALDEIPAGTQIELLWLNNNHITSKGAMKLTAMKYLQHLRLDRTDIDSQFITSLLDFADIQSISAEGTTIKELLQKTLDDRNNKPKPEGYLTIRKIFMERVIQQALSDADWRTTCAEVMGTHNITEFEVEEGLRELQPKSAAPKSSPQTVSTHGRGVRTAVLEVIVRQAMSGAPWRTLCKGPMNVNGITEEEVEAEMQRRMRR